MRIAQVTPFYPPVVGGVESAVVNAQLTGSLTFVTILIPVEIMAREKMIIDEMVMARMRENRFMLSTAPKI